MSEMTDEQRIELEAELRLREEVLKILTLRKATAESNAERGRIDKAMEAVEIGDMNMTMVKAIVRDIKKTQTIIEKASKINASDMTLDDIIKTYNFYVSSSGNAVWYYQAVTADIFGNRSWYSIKRDALQASFPATDVRIRGTPDTPDYDSLKEFNIRLVDQGRVFNRVVQSYRDEAGALNIMNRDFCMPSADGRTDYHWIFDAVIETITGGEAAAREAMERTIFGKYLHPENPFIPNPTIRDVQGRAGKGLVANTFLKRLFNGNVADNCNADHVIGKFNGVIAGKAVVVVNETNRSKIDSERTKAFLGSPRILVENKYQTPYYADNTCLVFFFTNDPNGGVNVSGTSSDNRFSFFRVKENIYSICQRYFREQESRELTVTEVQDWIEGTDLTSGQVILFNEEQVGRWIRCMIERYGDVRRIEPYHGDEHRAVIDRQRGAWTHTVEQVFEDDNFEYIRAGLLVDLIREYNRGEMLPGRNRMRDEIDRLVQDRGYDVELTQRGRIRTGPATQIQRPIWRRKSVTIPQHDETRYGHEDSNGRWIWTWMG
jgi:hypothetical protein